MGGLCGGLGSWGIGALEWRQLPIIYCFLHKFNIIWPVLRSNCATIVEVGCGQGQPRATTAAKWGAAGRAGRCRPIVATVEDYYFGYQLPNVFRIIESDRTADIRLIPLCAAPAAEVTVSGPPRWWGVGVALLLCWCAAHAHRLKL